LSTTNSAQKLRRSIGDERLTRQFRVSLPVPTAEAVDVLSKRYSVARGTILRAAIEAGLKATREQLRRAARSGTRDGHVPGHAGAAGGPREAGE